MVGLIPSNARILASTFQNNCPVITKKRKTNNILERVLETVLKMILTFFGKMCNILALKFKRKFSYY